MPFYQRIYSPGQLQFITSSTYRRAALFFSDRFCRCFVQRLEEVRQEWHFLLIGWVLMPEHFHLLIKPEAADTTPLTLKGLKEESAKRSFERCARTFSVPGAARRSRARDCRPPSMIIRAIASGSAASTRSMSSAKIKSRRN
jgi:REP element-mobilizing transposase RayT